MNPYITKGSPERAKIARLILRWRNGLSRTYGYQTMARRNHVARNWAWWVATNPVEPS